MNHEWNLELLTPCFCAGADQSKAELRVPSFRGELRWWLRACGANREQESRIMGGVQGTAKKSAVRMRISNVQRGSDITLPTMRMGTPLAYLLFYVSGKEGNKFGPRWQQSAIMPPGTRFTLTIQTAQESALCEADLKVLDTALAHFLHLGAIGLRATRACGVWGEQTGGLELKEFSEWAHSCRADIYVVERNHSTVTMGTSDWDRCLMCMEDTLKTLRKQWGAGKHGDRPSPLGLSKGWRDARDAQRQASAVSLRPVRIKMDDKAVLMPVVYECNAGLHPTIEPTGGLDGFPIEGGANLRKL